MSRKGNRILTRRTQAAHALGQGGGGTLLVGPVLVALKDRYFIAVKGNAVEAFAFLAGKEIVE